MIVYCMEEISRDLTPNIFISSFDNYIAGTIYGTWTFTCVPRSAPPQWKNIFYARIYGRPTTWAIGIASISPAVCSDVNPFHA